MERWSEVGPLLQAARADMKVGQMVCGEAFSLFEAMSALEAGNPKMDAAASPAADRPTLETLLADPTVAPWDLPAPELLDVLDQLLAMEASWHTGGSAMQTVYACLYMLQLDRPEPPALASPAARALFAYCRALQSDCAAVRDLAIQGGVCEEEDLNIFTVGIPFEPPLGAAAAAQDALNAAIDAAAGAASSSSSSNGSSSNGTSSSSGSAAAAAKGSNGAAANGAAAVATAAGADLGQAVAWRLQLRRALHLGLKEAGADDPKVVAASAARFAEARQLVPLLRASSRLAASQAASQAPAASASSTSPVPLSSSPSASSSSTPSSSNAASAPASSASCLGPAFPVDVNRHLLGPAPPRQVQVMSVSDALSYFERMLEHLHIAVSISEHVHDYRSLQLYLWRFARMRPGSVARSCLHSLLLPERWQGPQGRSKLLSHLQPPPGPPQAQGEASSPPQQPPQDQGEPQASTASSSGGGGSEAAGGKGGKGRKGGKGGKASAAESGGSKSGDGASTSAPQTTPVWVPTKHMIAAACMVPYRTGMPEEADVFFEQAVIAVANVCQSLLMNRCRSRRRLRRCLDDWLNMWHHGYNADVAPAFREHLRATGWRWRPLEGQPPEEEQGPLSTWVEFQTGATMLHHLLLGFELELYEPLEYDMLYWYCDYLCTCMVNVATALLQRCPPMAPPPAAAAAAGASGPGAGLGGGRGLGRGLGARGGKGAAAAGGRGGEAAKAAAAAALVLFEKEQMQLRYEVLEVEATQHMCQGMLRLMAGLRLAGAVSEPREPPPFNGGAQRFEQRFGSFLPLLRPPPLSWEDYTTSMDVGGRDAAFLLGLAGRSFKEARVRCAALAPFAPFPDVASGWVRGLERAAALNAVVSGVLGAKLGSGEKVKWECDWSQHPYFPAIALPKNPAPPAAAAATSTAPAAPAATASSS